MNEPDWEVLYRLPTTQSKVYTTHINGSSKEDFMKVFQTEHSKGIIVDNIKKSPVKLFPIIE